MSLKISMIGDIFLDIIAKDLTKLPAWEVDTLSNISIYSGGSCLNAIIHAKTFVDYVIQKKESISNNNIGDHVELCLYSSVGDDSQGKLCLQSLLSNQLSVNYVLCQPHEKTGTCIVLSGSKGRGFVTDRGCIDKLSIYSFDQESLFDCNHFHFSGFYNCSGLRVDAISTFRKAHSKGITTSLNPQYDASEKWDGIQDLCPYLTLLILNKDELSKITKISRNDENDTKEEKNDIVSNAHTLLDWGCRIVIITKGSQGCQAVLKNEQNEIDYHNINGLFVDQILDSTGAGDAFIGGFLVTWVKTKDVIKSMFAGCVCGAASVMNYGGSSSTFHSIESVIKRNGLHHTQFSS